MAKLIGIGVGPGDPELLTVKAYRLLQDIDIIFVPGKNIFDSMAYKIASQMVDLSRKKLFCFDMPMTKDVEVLKKAHTDAVKLFEDILSEGKDILCLTIGDPTVYSTFMYIHKQIAKLGYETQIVPGITSFCASAAALGISLCEGKESLHIIPASYEVENMLRLNGTKVLMKSASKIKEVKDKLHDKTVYMVENCGMENEKRYDDAKNIPETSGYYSLIIVKDESKA